MECQAITHKSRTSKPISTAMLSITASTRSHKTSSPAYKFMASANYSSTPSTIAVTIHDAPCVSSSSRHNNANGSWTVVERDRERDNSIHAAFSIATTSIRSVRSSRIRSSVMRDGSVMSSCTSASTNDQSSRLTCSSRLRHYDSGGARRSVSSQSQWSDPSIFSRVLLELESVIGVLLSTVDKVLLTLLVLQHPPSIHQLHLQKYSLPINLPFIMGIVQDEQIPHDLFISLLPANPIPFQNYRMSFNNPTNTNHAARHQLSPHTSNTATHPLHHCPKQTSHQQQRVKLASPWQPNQ